MASQITALKEALTVHSSPEKAEFLKRYFKTGPGEYAEGDQLIGVNVPTMRKLARQYRDIPLVDVEKLLHSQIHEYRYTALLLLVDQYKRGDIKTRNEIVKIYLRSTKYINNWDLVDTSAPYILGPHLYKGNRKVLFKLVDSDDIWQQRIAILTTQYFIREGDYMTTLELAERLLAHPHDLLHKAVGWMLREVGNRDLQTEENFLKTHYKNMPRTMLRYAIEKFPESKRQAYLKGKI